MGYTHYFTPIGPAPTDAQWSNLLREVRAIYERFADVICRESDRADEPPHADDEFIVFNGRKEDGYETFVLERATNEWNFCKTNRKPYDNAVVLVLRAVLRHCPGWLGVSSDGGYELFDLEQGEGVVTPYDKPRPLVCQQVTVGETPCLVAYDALNQRVFCAVVEIETSTEGLTQEQAIARALADFEDTYDFNE
jgi:hypothetical protein